MEYLTSWARHQELKKPGLIYVWKLINFLFKNLTTFSAQKASKLLQDFVGHPESVDQFLLRRSTSPRRNSSQDEKSSSTLRKRQR